MTADTPRATPGGTSFVAPAGFTLRVDGARVVLVGPEPDLKNAIVDVPSAKTAEEAVTAAWPAIHPDFRRPVRLVQSSPGRHGWDETKVFDYETSPNEKLIVAARALRHGDAWTVTVIETGIASFEKRLAPLVRLIESIRPKGYERESFAGKAPHTLDVDRVKQILDFVEEGRETLELPGVAVSLVQNGKVLFEKGLGVRALGKPDKVDADTRFMIASNTKALTTLLLAEEIDEKKLTWDTPVVQVYPAFKLGDADTTSKVLVRHLVCACTGLPRQDFEWYFEFKNGSAERTLSLLGTMQPTTKFGETFQYSNLMAAAAGFVAGHVANPKKELGAAYDEAMRTKIFAPLGMSRTTFDFAAALQGDHAEPHGLDVDGNVRGASMDSNYSAVPIRPAGGAWSSVHDVTRYVQMELAKGKLPDGKTLVSESSLLERRKPQVAVGEDETYGMGLTVDTHTGVAVVHHGGDLIGFHSDMFWFPEVGVGGVILTNGDTGPLLRSAYVRKVAEVLFDGKPEAMEDVRSSAKRLKDAIRKDRERLVVPLAPEVAAALAKRYVSKELGEVVVRANGPARVLDFGEWKSAVASRKNDDGTVSLITIAPGDGGMELVVGEKSGKKALIVRDAQHEYAFVEEP
jgi:CubicO group peptidase (beta-lactamase class C family)